MLFRSQIDGATVVDFILGGSRITADGDCSHEIKRRLLLGRKVKESEEVSLNLNIYKTKIMASGLYTSWKIDGETMETVTDFIFEGPQNHCRW